jgi:hypothetical protein
VPPVEKAAPFILMLPPATLMLVSVFIPVTEMVFEIYCVERFAFVISLRVKASGVESGVGGGHADSGGESL